MHFVYVASQAAIGTCCLLSTIHFQWFPSCRLIYLYVWLCYFSFLFYFVFILFSLLTLETIKWRVFVLLNFPTDRMLLNRYENGWVCLSFSISMFLFRASWFNYVFEVTEMDRTELSTLLTLRWWKLFCVAGPLWRRTPFVELAGVALNHLNKNTNCDIIFWSLRIAPAYFRCSSIIRFSSSFSKIFYVMYSSNNQKLNFLRHEQARAHTLFINVVKS